MKLSVILVLAALIAAAIAGPAHSIDVEGPGCVGEVVTLISGGEWEQDNGNYAAVYELNVQNNGVCAMSTIQLDLGLPDGATVIDTWELSEGPSYYLLATYPTLDVGDTGLAGFIAEFTTSPVPSSLNVTLTARCPRSCMEYFPNTQAPVDPTEEPVEPTEEPTEGPVDPTEEPVEPTEEPTEAPVDPTEEPVEPTETPTEGPVDPTEEPAEPTEEPTEAPVDPTEEPVGPSCSVSVGLQAREGGSNYSQIWDVNITNTGNSAVSSLSIDIVAADGSEVTQVWDLSLVDGTTYAVDFWEKLVANGDKHDGAGFEVVGSEDAPTVSVSAVAC